VGCRTVSLPALEESIRRNALFFVYTPLSMKLAVPPSASWHIQAAQRGSSWDLCVIASLQDRNSEGTDQL